MNGDAEAARVVILTWLAIFLALFFAPSCAVAVPATVATSYVTGQVIAVYMPDSIEQPMKGRP